jgi:hypothetical protein
LVVVAFDTDGEVVVEEEDRGPGEAVYADWREVQKIVGDVGCAKAVQGVALGRRLTLLHPAVHLAAL